MPTKSFVIIIGRDNRLRFIYILETHFWVKAIVWHENFFFVVYDMGYIRVALWHAMRYKEYIVMDGKRGFCCTVLVMLLSILWYDCQLIWLLHTVV